MESLQVVLTFDQVAPWPPPFLVTMYHWEDTQELLDGLHYFSGQVMSSMSSCALKGLWKKGCPMFFIQKIVETVDRLIFLKKL